MQIRDVEAVALYRDLDERFANAQKWIDSREYCLVRIETDDGTVGWGECWGPVAGNREVVEEYVTPWLIGKDPRDVERIHDELTFKLRSSYHSYVPASVVSGVDMALWDCYGKIAGESVSRLLGGRRREAVQAYATGHFFPDVDGTDAFKRAVVEEAEGNVDAGFDALKVKIGVGRHFPWSIDTDVEILRAIRDAVGDDIRLMADANHGYDTADARRVGRRLNDLDIYFFEEPIGPQHVEEYARLNRELDVPIAGGECWAFVEEFDRVFDRQAVSYAQPDVTSAGGITSMRRIASLADARNVQCLPHVFGSVVALAASLQVLATIPGNPMLEFDRTPNPIRDELAVDPIVNEGASVAVPGGPGLGIEIDHGVLERFRVD
ncbi:mandelate racemase/muconate lactonizing enzyme family protein [Halalkalicoccus sp. NIPERK01]|uniref:mandelate racemase/muconate lactonizing enzyme family protein n=1 Tax=Halalkalicoccus sp. NIPERK01 TaxID=3053469 RepID=UPI00256E9DC6|nr:mandelate racemase/muconate lactonizing enzyme family protein [Halalkalicoccus sp. NIPERK01]MDL5363472.1 mandelate racemase/muconate lactonizing enzyme family protein [Halalkalicoccus sp. NIPERK01]